VPPWLQVYGRAPEPSPPLPPEVWGDQSNRQVVNAQDIGEKNELFFFKIRQIQIWEYNGPKNKRAYSYDKETLLT
jgi:hypothetical protein